MRLFILSLLAIGSVHSLSVGYPYRTGLQAFNPSRGEFPVQSSVVKGYLRHLDNNGVERLVGYSYPEPVYGIRQVSYVRAVPSISTPILRTYEADEFARAQEAHFRAWSLQQYQALKSEIDAFRAMGKQPPADLLEKFRPLEQIALASNFNSIAEIPEVKRVRDEHLDFWSSARIQDLQKPVGEIKTYVQHSVPLTPVEETAEQKLARQEHLRIYQEQLNKIQQSQMQGDGKMVTQSQNIPEPPNRLSAQTDGITEVERATQEHLRLWNEAKLRAEQASLRDEELAKQTAAVIKSQGVGEHSTSDLHKAHEQHLRLVNDLTAKIHGGEASLEHKYVSQLKSGSPVEQTIVSHVETPEVIKAREEHYRLVNEAKLKAENVEHKHQPVDSLKSQAEGLAEIERATQEHLRLWNEAKLRAEQASLKDEELAKQKVTSFQSTPETVAPQPTIGLRSSHEEHLGLINEATAKLQGAQSHVESQVKFDNSQEHYQVHHLSGGVVDTPEVMRAREEHLRLVNEAKLRSESVEHKHDVQVPAIKTVPHQQQSTFQSDHVAVIADTPEVIKAREEHLRLVNEANAKAQSIVHKEEQHQVVQMPVHGERSRLVDDAKVKAQSVDYQTGVVSSPQHQTIVLPEETPEVIEAREQHLRIFNAVKSYIENEEKSKSRLIADTDGKSYTMEEQRIIEEERMREAERLQEEQRQLELDRMREAERLAVEQRQMELELIRLKQEEEQRLQMELMEEKLRLKAEQDQLSQVVIVEEGQRQKDTAPAEKYQQVVLVEENRSNQIPQQAYQPASNPFLPNLKFDTTQSSSGSIQENKFIQSSTQMPISSYSTSHMEKSDTPSMAAVRYIQSSQNSIGSKQQYVQQEVSKTSSDHASFQPADTAAALIHLEKVRQEHFRAHEQALEQLRLARVQSASLKDCNH